MQLGPWASIIEALRNCQNGQAYRCSVRDQEKVFLEMLLTRTACRGGDRAKECEFAARQHVGLQDPNIATNMMWMMASILHCCAVMFVASSCEGR